MLIKRLTNCVDVIPCYFITHFNTFFFLHLLWCQDKYHQTLKPITGMLLSYYMLLCLFWSLIFIGSRADTIVCYYYLTPCICIFLWNVKDCNRNKWQPTINNCGVRFCLYCASQMKGCPDFICIALATELFTINLQINFEREQQFIHMFRAIKQLFFFQIEVNDWRSIVNHD